MWSWIGVAHERVVPAYEALSSCWTVAPLLHALDTLKDGLHALECHGHLARHPAPEQAACRRGCPDRQAAIWPPASGCHPPRRPARTEGPAALQRKSEGALLSGRRLSALYGSMQKRSANRLGAGDQRFGGCRRSGFCVRAIQRRERRLPSACQRVLPRGL